MMLLLYLMAGAGLLALLQWKQTRPDPARDPQRDNMFRPRWPALRVRGRNTWCDTSEVHDGYEATQVAVLHCKAGPEEHVWNFQSAGAESCLDRMLACGGESACAWACLHEGDCVGVCPTEAIRMKKGLPEIDAAACTGCGACVTSCPTQVLGLIPRDAQLYPACQSGDTSEARVEACSKCCTSMEACSGNDFLEDGLVRRTLGRSVLDYTRSANLLPLLALCPSSSFRDRIPHRPWFSVNEHCTACGDCLPLCPAPACILPDGSEADTPIGRSRVRIEPSRCVGCGLCVPACDVQAIRVVGAVGYELHGRY